jgi:hypothetical protein
LPPPHTRPRRRKSARRPGRRSTPYTKETKAFHGWPGCKRRRKRDGGEAIRELRSRALAQAARGDYSIRGKAGEKEHAPIEGQKISKVTKEGTIIYQVGQEAIRDRGVALDMTGGVSDETLLMSLKMACRRFGNRIQVEGDESFRKRVSEIIKTANLNIVITNIPRAKPIESPEHHCKMHSWIQEQDNRNPQSHDGLER